MDSTDSRPKTKTYLPIGATGSRPPKSNVDTFGSMIAGGELLHSIMREMAEPTPPPHVTVTIKLNDRIVEGNIIALEDDGVVVEYFEQGLRFKLLIGDLSKISLI